jgi:hypothetical protein
MNMIDSARPSALRALLACSLLAFCAPAMSENFFDKLKKATDTIERSRDSAKRTIDDVNDLGGGKSKKARGSASGSEDGGPESTTMKTANAGEAQFDQGPAADLRQQVGRMGSACRERSAEGAGFTSCAEACSAAGEKISSSAKGAANDEAHASCQASYNQAMGLAPAAGAAGSGSGDNAAPAPAKVESGQSPMPGAN